MPNEFKVTAYVVASVTLVAAFLSALRPYLLQNPPNAVALLALGFVVGLFLFSVIAGPFLVMYLRPYYRVKAQQLLRFIFWVFLAGALISIIMPAVPSITPAALACFAITCLLLRATAIYAPMPRMYIG
jgi:hypothetical protein